MRTILVSAYACEPLKGSEQGVGWNWVLQMAKRNKLHVITRANNQIPIETYLPKDLATNITFHYYDTAKPFRFIKKWPGGLYFYYLFWQIGIIRLVWKIKNKYAFDYSMHLTFGNVWLPTFLPFFNIAFIWGSLGGGESIPNSFLLSLPFDQFFIQFFRKILILSTRINLFFLFASFRAKCIICRTEDTAHIFPKVFRKKIKLMSDGAIEPEIFNYSRIESETNPTIKLVTTSRLIPFKNVKTAIKSLMYISESYSLELTIIGSGYQKRTLEKLAYSPANKHKVSFISDIPRDSVLQIISEHDIFVYPSLREANNLAILEAMAIGLPVVCLNWSGMAISTDDDCAFRLPVSSPEQMPKDMAKAICSLIDHPDLMKQMGTAARSRIKNVFNWEAKGIFMEDLFNELDSKKRNGNV